MSTEKKDIIITPKGIIKFPELQGAVGDSGKTEYSFAIALDPKDKEVKALLKEFDELFDQVKGGNSPMYKDDYAKNEVGEKVKTGLVIVNLKSQYPIPLYDSKKNKLNPDITVGWGTVAKVAIKIDDEFNFRGKVGVKKYPVAIQVLELKEAGYTADSLGFQDEDGFEATTEQSIPF